MVGLEGGTGRRFGSPGRKSSIGIREPPEQLASRLHAYAAAGISHVQLVLDPITTESIASLRGLLDILDGE
jgi:hypothetical protein